MKLSSEELKELALHKFRLNGHNNKFTGIDSLLIWQYVRANPKYRHDFSVLKKELERYSEEDDYCDSLEQRFCAHWSISEPIDFKLEKIPENLTFIYRLVRKIESLSREKYLFDWNQDPSQPEVLLAINTRADKRLVLREIESYLETAKDDLDQDRLRPNNLTHLTDNFLCFYLKEVLGLSKAQVKREYRKVYAGGDLQDAQLSEKIQSFSKIAAKAPWCFFVAAK